MSGRDRVPCRECRAAWARQDEHPPCPTCHPGVHPYNQAAYALWPLVMDQVIWASNGMGARAMALSLPAIESALRLSDVDQSEYSLVAGQLLSLGAQVLEIVRGE